MNLDPVSRSEYEWYFMMYQASLFDSSIANLNFIEALSPKYFTYFKPDSNYLASTVPVTNKNKNDVYPVYL